MIKVDLFIGRFQPPHKGHLGIINNKMGTTRNVKCIVGVSGIKNKYNGENPYNEIIRTTLIREFSVGEVVVFMLDTGYIGDIDETLKLWGYTIDRIFLGADRSSNYKEAVKIYGEEFEVIETERVCSGAEIREAIKSDSKEFVRERMPVMSDEDFDRHYKVLRNGMEEYQKLLK